MELVEAVSGGHGERVRVREGVGALVDHRLHVLREKPLGLLARLPDIEDPEHACLVVETGGVHDQPGEGPVTDLVGDEVVVLGRAIRDCELLNVGDCHRLLLWTVSSILRARPRRSANTMVTGGPQRNQCLRFLGDPAEGVVGFERLEVATVLKVEDEQRIVVKDDLKAVTYRSRAEEVRASAVTTRPAPRRSLRVSPHVALSERVDRVAPGRTSSRGVVLAVPT